MRHRTLNVSDVCRYPSVIFLSDLLDFITDENIFCWLSTIWKFQCCCSTEWTVSFQFDFEYSSVFFRYVFCKLKEKIQSINFSFFVRFLMFLVSFDDTNIPHILWSDQTNSFDLVFPSTRVVGLFISRGSEISIFCPGLIHYHVVHSVDNMRII